MNTVALVSEVSEAGMRLLAVRGLGPERIIGAGRWVRLFRAAGFLSIPYGLRRPASAMTVYRGATTGQHAGMSWTPDINRVGQFRQRHSWHTPAAIYRTVVMPEAVLALREREGKARPQWSWTLRAHRYRSAWADPSPAPPRNPMTPRQVNRYYFYCVDADFWPFSGKTLTRPA